MPFRAAPRASCAGCRGAIRGWSACRCTRRARCCWPAGSRLAEWLYEAGIGEARAALVEHGTIVEARIELDDGAPRVGARLSGRLVDAREGRVALAEGGEVLLNAPARGVTQGGALTVEIEREAIPAPGRAKPPRAIPTDEPPADAPDLLARITASGVAVRRVLAPEPAALAA